jgi:hypothetical protein
MLSVSQSKIIRKPSHVSVPKWILDDVGYFYPEVYDHIVRESEINVTFSNDYDKTFCQFRKQIYWMCNWYEDLVSNGIPVISAKFYCINNDPEQMISILDQVLTEDKFIRFCNGSPKDIETPIYGSDSDPEEIIKVFKESARTFYMFSGPHPTHLIVRPVVKIEHEVRCFWHRNKLRAVSGPDHYVEESEQKEIKETVNDFFQTHGPSLCFNSATIDLGITTNTAFVIEINSFGLDMLAGAEFFSWKDDFNILYDSTEPVYKFKPPFRW